MEGTNASFTDGGEEIERMSDNEKLKQSLVGDAASRENVDITTTNTMSYCGGVDTMVLTETLEALDVGKETAASLQDQEERLRRSENIMDSTQYVLDKARVVLRGMTFLGSIRNFFSEEPVLQRNINMRDGEILEGFLCSECKAMFEGPDPLQQHYAACHVDHGNYDMYLHSNPSSCNIQDPTIQAQQDYIDSLLPVVGEMNVLSQSMGTSIRQQNNSLRRMNSKQETLKDNTLLVTRKASRIAGLDKRRTKKGQENPACRVVVLRHVGRGSSRKSSYMCVEGGDVRLVEEEVTTSGSWQLHDLGNGFCGLRSCMSKKWLGQGPLGGVRCTARRLGRWEEWQRVDDGEGSPSHIPDSLIFKKLDNQISDPIKKTLTTHVEYTTEADRIRLICCGADFGGGGYLCSGTQVSGSVTTLGVLACSKGIYARQKAAVFDVLDVDTERSNKIEGGRIQVIG